jgi:hypothetical protein
MIMAKYVIAYDLEMDAWWAYRKVFGLWGLLTTIDGTCSVISAEECEQKLRCIINHKGKLIIKEVEL